MEDIRAVYIAGEDIEPNQPLEFRRDGRVYVYRPTRSRLVKVWRWMRRTRGKGMAGLSVDYARRDQKVNVVVRGSMILRNHPLIVGSIALKYCPDPGDQSTFVVDEHGYIRMEKK